MASGDGQESQSGYRNEESLEAIDREQMNGRDDGDGMR